MGTRCFFSATSSVVGLLAYFYIRFGFGVREGASINAVIVTARPFLLMNIPFWLGIIVSIWRTSVGTSIVID